MRKHRKEPEKKQWRNLLSKVKFFATALYWAASFILILLEIWDKLAN